MHFLVGALERFEGARYRGMRGTPDKATTAAQYKMWPYPHNPSNHFILPLTLYNAQHIQTSLHVVEAY
jgi:hypothetical protein